VKARPGRRAARRWPGAVARETAPAGASGNAGVDRGFASITRSIRARDRRREGGGKPRRSMRPRVAMREATRCGCHRILVQRAGRRLPGKESDGPWPRPPATPMERLAGETPCDGRRGPGPWDRAGIGALETALERSRTRATPPVGETGREVVDVVDSRTRGDGGIARGGSRGRPPPASDRPRSRCAARSPPGAAPERAARQAVTNPPSLVDLRATARPARPAGARKRRKGALQPRDRRARPRCARPMFLCARRG